MPSFGFSGASFTSESIFVDYQRTVNFYPEIVSSTRGRNTVALYRTPGLLQYALNGAGGACRGLFAWHDQLWAVMGGILYRYSSAGIINAYGGLFNDQLPVSFAANPDFMMIVSGGLGYYFDFTTSILAQIVDPDFPLNVIACAYQGGYYLALTATALYFSAVDDPTSWDALDFIEVLSSSNTLVGLGVDSGQVLVFGTQVIQPFTQSASDPPFVPIQGSTIDQGLGATFAIAVLDNAFHFLGVNDRGGPVVWELKGFAPQKISNNDIENAMQHYSTVSDAIMTAFQMNGHTFLQISFPTANATWRYDTSNGMWHEALRWVPNPGFYDAHISQHHVYVFGKHIVGDRLIGKLYEMNTTFLDDDGTTIRRLRRAPFIFDPLQNVKVFIKWFELVMAVGLGLNSGAFTDPQVMLRFSRDGGHNWSNWYNKSAGKIGKFNTRLRWLRLGWGRPWIVEVVVTDSVDWCLIDGLVEAEAGKN